MNRPRQLIPSLVQTALFTAVALGAFLAAPAKAEDPERYAHGVLEARRPEQIRGAPAERDAYLRAGKAIYEQRCAPCHGETGAGDGLAAAVMRPRPRDLTAGNFAFRNTRSGELPTDGDLYRVVARGLPGTAMPAWGEGVFRLNEEEIWQVVYYVKSLSGIFWDEYMNPYREVAEGETAPLLEIGEPPTVTDSLVARGKQLYEDETLGGCVRCHGREGRGDGEAAAEQIDDLGNPTRPADLTNPWRIKNGYGLTDYYRTLSTGLNGTPMADFLDGIPDDADRWALAAYSASFIEERSMPEGPLTARRVSVDLPDDPNDDLWKDCAPFGLPLMGQFIKAPRWQNPSVDRVLLCALYNEREIAIRIEWNDPFRDDVASHDRGATDGEAPADGAAEIESATGIAGETGAETGTGAEAETGIDGETGAGVGMEIPGGTDAAAETGTEAAETGIDGETSAGAGTEIPGGTDAAAETSTEAAETGIDVATQNAEPVAEGDDGTSSPLAADPKTYITVAAMNERAAAGGIPDRLAIHFGVGHHDAQRGERPAMLMGDPEHPIQAWLWSAEGDGRFSEANASGPADSYDGGPAEGQKLGGGSDYHAGRWRVVFRRPLTTDDTEHDTQLAAGDLVPFTVRVWDGSAGEDGLQSATSSWSHIYLESSIPASAYLRALLVTALGYGFMAIVFLRVRKGRSKGTPTE